MHPFPVLYIVRLPWNLPESIYQFLNGEHLGHFQFRAMTNEAAENILVCVLW